MYQTIKFTSCHLLIRHCSAVTVCTASVALTYTFLNTTLKSTTQRGSDKRGSTATQNTYGASYIYSQPLTRLQTPCHTQDIQRQNLHTHKHYSPYVCMLTHTHKHYTLHVCPILSCFVAAVSGLATPKLGTKLEGV